MTLRLQPDLHPWPRWQRRLVLSTLALGAVLLLGLVAPVRRRPPRLLVTGSDEATPYVIEVPRLLAAAKERIWVMLFVARAELDDPEHPVTALCRVLAATAKRGVDVRVVLDLGRDWDTGEVEPKHEAVAAWLRQHGVRVIIDELELTTHSKMLLIDASTVIIGSHNWTDSALVRNREASVLLQDQTVADEVAAVFAEVPGFVEEPGDGE
jgi:phosphatidylserine/phosphatidylglycerophosphate/cardiolipin synthase-like enzyme